MSKTIGNVLNPIEIIEKYGTETLRYYLLKRGALFTDADFSVGELEVTYNADLANGLGNLVSRVAKLCEKSKLKFDKVGSRSCIEFVTSSETAQLLDNYKFNEALGEIWEKIAGLDKFIDETKPWILEGEELEKALQRPVEEIREIAVLLEPFLPETSQKVQTQFLGPWIKSSEPLFPRIT